MNDKNMNELRKFAEENGLEAESVIETAKKIAVVKKIEKIAFRASRALYSELSLIYDELSLCETIEEAESIAESKLIPMLAVQKALGGTAQKAAKAIMDNERPAELPDFFREIAELPDDDEVIVAWLIDTGEEAVDAAKEVLREYVEKAFEGDCDGDQ